MADYSLIEGALQRGYSMDEIADKLAQAEGFDPSAIRARGYGAEDIIGRLGYVKPETSYVKPETSDVARGFVTSFKQLPQLGYGLLAGAGAVAESVAGEGGVSTSMKNFGVKKYQEAGADIEKDSKQSDSLSYSWEQAKQGDFGSLVDWLQYGIGYGGGQAVQALATAGVGSLVGKTVLKGTAENLASKMVAKEALRLGATEEAKRLTAQEISKIAVANVASNIGQTVAIGSQAFGMEGGEIFGDLAQKTVKEGRAATGGELAKAFGATAAAGALEFVGDKLGVDVMLGKSKMFKPASSMTGVGGRAARAAVAVPGTVLAEGGTEYLQTGIEEYGKGNEKNFLPFMQSESAQKQALDAAGLGAVGGGGMAMVGGAFSSPQKKDAAPSPSPSISSAQTADDAIAAFQDEVASVTPRGSFGNMDELAGFIEAERSDIGKRRGLLAQQQQDARDMENEFNGLVKDEQIDQSYRLNDAQRQRDAERARDGGYDLALQQREEQQGRTVEQLAAASEAQGFGNEEPTAMQLAMQRAQQKALDNEFSGLLKQERASLNEMRANVKRVAGVPVEQISTPQLEEIAQSEAHPNTKMAAVAALNDRHDAIQQERERLMQLREARLERQADQSVQGEQPGAVPDADNQANVKALTENAAKRQATQLTNQGYPTVAYPHPTQSGMWAIGLAEEAKTANLTQNDAPSRPSASWDEQPAIEVKQPIPRKKPSPDNIAQAIINLGGISTSLKNDILGDAATRTRPGFFTSNGTTDLGALASRLSGEFGFSQINLNDATDNSGAKQLADLIARAVNGESILNEEAMIRAQEAEEVARHQDDINRKAEELGIKPSGRGRPFSKVEAEVLKLMEIRLNKEIEEAGTNLEEARAIALRDLSEEQLAEIQDKAMDALGENPSILETYRALAAGIKEAVNENERNKKADTEGSRSGIEVAGAGHAEEASRPATSGTAREGQSAEAEVAPEFGLVGQTEEEAIAEEQARRDEDQRKADEDRAEKSRIDAEAVARRNEQNANTVASDNFQLGQSSQEVRRMVHSGMVDMFGAGHENANSGEAKDGNTQDSASTEQGGASNSHGERIHPRSDLPDGTRIVDGNGNPYRVHYQRNSLVVAHPIIDGKPVVSADTSVRFWVDPNREASGENDRLDPIYRDTSTSQEQPAVKQKPADQQADAIETKKTASGVAMFSRADGNQPWYFSALEDGIRNAKLKTQPASQWVAWIRSQQQFKKEEVEWSGILDHLASLGKERVTSGDLAQWVAENGVRVEEVVLGEDRLADLQKQLDEINDRYNAIIDEHGVTVQELPTAAKKEIDDLTVRHDEIADRIADTYHTDYATKHASGNLVLPGGTDHREIVLTVPTIEPYNESDSTHYGDVGNGKQIAWARVNTRTDANGNKVLFVEEIQSQRNQHGRKQGFTTQDSPVYAVFSKSNYFLKSFDLRKEAEKFAESVSGEVREEKREPGDISGVPTAPFVSTKDGKPVDSYIPLVLKRLIAYAVETGHDAISWTTGEQQADRYDLSKQIDTIYSGNNGDGTWAISAKKGDMTVFRQDRLPEKELPEYVGKDAADKIIASGDGIKLSGLDLKVGGGWTASMYGDASGLNAQGKPSMIAQAARKLGAEVSSIQLGRKIDPYIKNDGGVYVVIDDISGDIISPEYGYESQAQSRLEQIESERTQQPSFPITDQMREQASKGMPLFQRDKAQAGTSAYPLSKDQSAAERLNRNLADHFKDSSWENAYVQRNLPDSFNAVAEAARAAFGTRVVGITATEQRFNQFNGVNLYRTAYVNLGAKPSFVNIAGHEIYHSLEKERPDLHQWFVAQARKHFRNFDEYQAKLNALVSANEQPYTREKAESELLADFTGDALADPKFLAQLAEADGSKFRRLLNAVVGWLKLAGEKLTGKNLGSSAYFNDVNELRKFLNRALIAYSSNKPIDRILALDEPRFMTAWHGSPHDHDGFDSSKIGTGEGAQAYGYGLYFAGSREVAEYYKNTTSIIRLTGVDGKKYGDTQEGAESTARALLANYKNDRKTFDAFDDGGQSYMGKIARDIKNGIIKEASGRLYKVELAPEPDEYLDWDKPLSEQAKADLLRDVADQESMPVNYRRKALHEGRTGEDFYKALSAVLGSDEAASKVLNSYGIRGIRYLDGSSRSAGEGNHNYVIFNDADVKITAKESRRASNDTTPENAGVSVSGPSESVRRIQAVVERFKSQFKGASALDIRVVSTTFDIPARFRPSPFAEGVFHDDAGLVYLVTMNLRNPRGELSESRAWQVLLHESVGHYGLSQMMGDKFAGILKAVKQATLAGRKVSETQSNPLQPGDKDYTTWEAVQLRYPDATDAEIAQEVLARMAETDPGSSIVGYAVAVVRQWVREMARAMGVNVMVSTSELRDLVAKASGYMRRGDNLAEERVPSGLVAASKSAGRLREKDVFGNGSKVQYFDDKRGLFYERQKYPSGRIGWRAGEVIDGMDYWLSDKEFGSMEEAHDAVRGLRISSAMKQKNAEKYGAIPALWSGEAKRVARAIIDAGIGVDRFSASTQSKSKYVYLESGVKVRIADHSLPARYDKADIDYRYGGDINALIAEIKEVEGAPSQSVDPDSIGSLSLGASRNEMQERPAMRADESGSPEEPAQSGGWAGSTDMLTGFGGNGKRGLESRARIIGDSGRQYTPEQQQMFKTVGRETNDLNTVERIKKWANKNWVQGIVDQFAPIKDIDLHAYTLTRLSKGAAGAFEAFMDHGKLSLKDGVYDADTGGGVMQNVFFPLGKETTDFLYWIAGNRAERLAKEGKERLFSPADIAASKALADGVTDFDYTLANGKTTRDRTLIYADSLKKFNEYNKNVMDMAEQSGLIDGASRHLWEHEFYVPFYRVMDESDGGVRGMNIKQGVVRQQAFKKLKGGEEGLNDLLANTLMNWAHLIDASAKNRAAKATLEAAQNLGIAQPAGYGEKKTVWYMGDVTRTIPKGQEYEDDGVTKVSNGTDKVQYHGRVEFSVSDPQLLIALQGLDYAGLRGPIMDILGKAKHMLTLGVTASPFFKIRNLIRDSVQAVGTSDLSYNIAKNLKQGADLTNHERQEYVSALAGGALIRFGTMLEGNEAARTRQLIKKGAKDEHILDNESKVRAFYDKYLEPGIAAYNELGNRGEEINRMALYDQLIKQGKSHAEASLMARDLMDFSLQGSFTTIRFLTQTVPFMNARLQGLYKLGRSAKDEPAKMAIVTGMVALASLALLAAYGDDDDWKKREDWDRNNYWWFKFAGVAFRIPKPFELGAIGTLSERSAELIFDNEMTGKRFKDVVLSVVSDQLSMNPVPQLVKPVIDIYANKDSFTGRPIESMSMEKLAPQYRYSAGTSMVARGASTAIGGALSPVQIDHLVRGYFSWLGAFAVGAADMAVRAASDEPTRPTMDYWKVATGGMVSDIDSSSSRYVSQMYEQAKELEQAYGTWRQLRKEGKIEDAAEYRADHAAELRKYHAIEGIKKAESKLNERIRMIERSNKEPAEKRDLIQQIQKQKDLIARRAF